MTNNTIPKVSFFDFIRRAFEIVKNPLPFHHDKFEEKGDTFILTLGFQKRIVFSRNAEFLKYTLQKNQRNYTKSEVQTKDVARYLGKGLLTSEGELWKKQRKLIQPTFHKRFLEGLLGIMKNTIDAELSRIPLNQPLNAEQHFGKLAFQVVANSLFSGEVEEKTIAKLQHTVEAAQKMLVRELRQPYLGWWFKYGGLLKRHFQMISEARNLIRKIIVERKQTNQRKGDLLDLLLEARYENGEPMEEEQMIDEILILFTAGHETTSNALCFTCQFLARNPKYQDEIVKENQDIPDENDLMSSIMSQKITRHVLEESMRLYPPAYFIDRMNFEEDEFSGMKLESKTPILFSIIEIHRHEELWERPLHFYPERFDGPPNQYSNQYFPFGAGPRMCIGNNFAMFEMQMVIAELLRRFKIKPQDQPIEILPLITLKPKNAILEFEQRKK